MDRLQVLETRIENLRKGIAEMADGSTIQVNKSFLSNALKYMVELSEIRRSEPANAPLTMDELRGMDGEPVYIVGRIYSGWTVPWRNAAKYIARCPDKANISYYPKDYGKTWLAYRYQPEPQQPTNAGCIYADRPFTGRIPTCEAGYYDCSNSPACGGYKSGSPADSHSEE